MSAPQSMPARFIGSAASVLVGARGFEPPTSSSRTTRATSCATPRPKDGHRSRAPSDAGPATGQPSTAGRHPYTRADARAPASTATIRLLIAWTLAAKVARAAARRAWRCGLVNGSLPRRCLEPWHRWDAPHYTDIAIWGYMANDPGNLPYPGLRAGLSRRPGSLHRLLPALPVAYLRRSSPSSVTRWSAAFVVSTVASLFVAPMLYRLVSADLATGHRRSRPAAFLLVFPTAYFLHIGYTESLFLALAFGSMWLARTNRWWAAGIARRARGAHPGQRPDPDPDAGGRGLAAVARAIRERRARADWLAIGGVAVGFAIYLGVNWSVYGDPFAFSEIQRDHWFKDLSPPWEGIAGMIDWTTRTDADDAFMLGWMELLFTGIGAAASVATAIWLRPKLGHLDGRELAAHRRHGLCDERAALQPRPLRHFRLVGADRRALAVGGMAAGCRIGAAMAYFTWRFAVGVWAF